MIENWRNLYYLKYGIYEKIYQHEELLFSEFSKKYLEFYNKLIK